MQLLFTVIMSLIGFGIVFFLSYYIAKTSEKELREEREEYEQDYVKWQSYVKKAKERLENPEMEEEKFSVWQKIGAFFSRTSLSPTLEELNEYEWDFLNEPVKIPVYSIYKRIFIGIVGAIAFGTAWYGYGLSIQLFLVIALDVLLLIITFVDLDAQIIPPKYNVCILLLGVIAIWLFPEVTFMQRVIGFFCISIPMQLVVMAVPGGFGGGDIKLMAAAGFLLGWKANVAAFFIGLILGGGYGIFALITKKRGRKEHFAFGPCLCIGIAIAMYCDFGSELLDLYLSSFVH